MNDKLYLPKAFDLQSHITKWQKQVPLPSNVKGPYLEYLIHLLVYKASLSDKYRDQYDGFIPLYSVTLRNISVYYRAHLDYLLATKVILESSYYSKERGITKAYKLTYKYSSSTAMSKKVTEKILLKKLQKINKEELIKMRAADKRYPYLGKSFEGLWINKAAAQEFVRGLHIMGIIYFGKERRKFEEKIAQMYTNIERIDSRDFSYAIDDSGYRFHSNLTALKKELRIFLTYRDKPLASIDFKNSQPYLSQILLTPNFWAGRSIDKRSPVQKSRAGKKPRETLLQHNTHPDNWFEGSKGKIAYNDIIELAMDGDTNRSGYRLSDSTRQSIIMFLLRHQADDNQDIARFHKLISKGTLYEFLLNKLRRLLRHDPALCKIFNHLGKPKIDRPFVKILTMIALYSAPGSKRAITVFAQRLFKTCFPSVSAVFRRLKQKNYRLLPILLQRIEADLILNRICREFWKKHRQPVFTIHDSIITLKDYLPKLKVIVNQVMNDAAGCAPQLEEEFWLHNHYTKYPPIAIFEKMKPNVFNEKDAVIIHKDGCVEFLVSQ